MNHVKIYFIWQFPLPGDSFAYGFHQLNKSHSETRPDTPIFQLLVPGDFFVCVFINLSLQQTILWIKFK